MNKNDGVVGMIVITGTILILLSVLGARWYRASVQSEVYAREGIAVSTWEVLIGVIPAERSVKIHD